VAVIVVVVSGGDALFACARARARACACVCACVCVCVCARASLRHYSFDSSDSMDQNNRIRFMRLTCVGDPEGPVGGLHVNDIVSVHENVEVDDARTVPKRSFTVRTPHVALDA
jgi:hypothetical protein